MKTPTLLQLRSGLLTLLILGLASVTVSAQTPTPIPTPFPTPTPGACGWARSALPMPIIDSAVASLDGNLYTFGGTTTNNVRLANSYKFDGTTWISIAPLPVALTGASAVTDGTSLYVLGGYSGTNVNTVYRYDPGSDTYTTLAPFAIATSSQAAAYFNGKIYKFGGYTNAPPSPTNALEIYNIALNQWTAGANYPASGISYARGFTLGSFIYGVGGSTGVGTGNTALTCRYDPGTNTWSDNAIADLPAPRSRVAAGAYLDGAVVAGGDAGGTGLASALFWDRASNTWSALPNMPKVYFNMNGAALGGSFYLVGGSSTSPPYTNDFQRLTCPFLPTPTPTPTGTPTPTPTPTPGICDWTPGPAYPIQISESAVTSLNGTLYSFGGRSNNVVVANSYKFDGTTWTAIAPLPEVLTEATAVNDGTSIYIPGGYTGNITSNRFYKYNPVANTYTTLEILVSPTARHGTACVGGKIYKLCGSLLESFPVNTLEIYDIATNTWTSGANYPLSLNYLSVFAQGNFIYAAGGFTFNAPGPTAKAYRYDPATNTWDDAAIADLPSIRYDAASAPYYDGGVLAGGTVGGTNSASVILWDPASNTWSNLSDMLGAHSKMNGAVLNNSFYVVGGRTMTFPNSSTDNQKLTCPPAPAPTPTPSPTPTPTPTPAPTPTPTSTPTPSPAQALNISTRMRVETGSNVLIGGFIVTGTAPKSVAIRGVGPSLAQFGIPDVLADPTLQLRDSSGAVVIQNDNWQDDPAQASQLTALGLALSDPNEAGIVASLSPGAAYTAILAGNNSGTGVGLVEVYDANPGANSQLANISTRGFVLTGSNVMIGGFILGGSNNTRVAVRGIGPSLAQLGLSPVLANPTLELRDSNGTLLVSNDNWQDDPASASQLTALGLAPSDPAESGIHVSLAPGAFTAILAGQSGGTGIGLVEIYNVH